MGESNSKVAGELAVEIEAYLRRLSEAFTILDCSELKARARSEGFTLHYAPGCAVWESR